MQHHCCSSSYNLKVIQNSISQYIVQTWLLLACTFEPLFALVNPPPKKLEGPMLIFSLIHHPFSQQNLYNGEQLICTNTISILMKEVNKSEDKSLKTKCLRRSCLTTYKSKPTLLTEKNIIFYY